MTTNGKLLNYVNGQWTRSSAGDYTNVMNPATNQALTTVPMSPGGEVDAAVQKAQEAYVGWRHTPVGDRIQPLFKLKQLLEDNLDAFGRIITDECGKTYAESVAEMRRGIENVEVACGAPVLMQGYNNEDIARGIDEHMFRQPLGVVAAIRGGATDIVMSRIVDAIMSVPVLISALVVLQALGSSLPVLIITIGLLDSTRVFRLSRILAQGINAMEYAEVARLRGEGLVWMIRKEILPNAMPPLVAEFGLRFCFTFLFVAGLSYLGLGVQPPFADWGGMVRDNQQGILYGLYAPLFPAAAIALLTIGVNLVVDWLLAGRTNVQGENR